MEKKLRSPERSGLSPETNGFAPDDSGFEPDRHGSLPDAAGHQPDCFRFYPDTASFKPDSSGLKPDDDGASPAKSFSGENPSFPQLFQIFQQFKVGRRCSVASNGCGTATSSAALPNDQKGGDNYGKRPNCGRGR